MQIECIENNLVKELRVSQDGKKVSSYSQKN